MALQSQLFAGDPLLEAAAVRDAAHIVPGSRGTHVAKIQQALIQLDGAAIKPDGIYGPATAAAVRAFKQKRQILNFQGRLDDIVGIKTMAALDQGMAAKPAGGGPSLNFIIPGGLLDVVTLPFVDIVVRIRGGAPRDALANLGDRTAYNAKTPKRTLVPISKQAVDAAASDALIAEIVKEIDDQFKNTANQVGVICINGNSAGAINALQLAAKLKDKRKIKFLGLADAAMFPNFQGMNLPIAPPLVGRGVATNFPFWGSPPTFDAEIKQNFFQNADNNFTRLNFQSGPRWTGKIGGNQEIHGLISDFPGPPDPGDTSHSGGEKIAVPLTERLNAHTFAGDEGDKRNGAKITEILNAL